VLVTFAPHPLEVVNPEKAPPLLTVGDEKIEVLAEVGLDSVVVLPFTPQLQAYPPEAFVQLLRERLRMRELLIGHDHHFGKGRTGGVDMLRTLGARDRGDEVPVDRLYRLERWLSRLDEEGTVIHYDPETTKGFWEVPREKADKNGYIHVRGIPD
jgi:hypothetical protein